MNISIRKITTIGILSALAIALVALIHFPILPAASFLEYDPADIPILIVTFLLGPVEGLVMTVVVSVVQGITVSARSGPIGIVMHILATGSYALAAGLIYRRNKTRKQAALALILGSLCATVVMVGCNLVFTPIFMNQPLDKVIGMLLPVIIPFNLIKYTVNSVITFFVYKPLSTLIRR